MRATAACMALLVSAVSVMSGASILATACAAVGSPPNAPVEVVVAGVDAGGAPLPATATPAANGKCSARLIASSIQTAPGCTLDEHLSSDLGRLLYPCSGSGRATAQFGEHRFEGTLADGVLTVELSTDIDWEDGCHWQTHQRITGAFPNVSRSTPLVWSYTEGPVTGANCFGSCRATAGVSAGDLEAPAER